MARISVVLTCFNEGALLRRAVASLEAQSNQDFETIVVNDGSDDAVTNSICRELEAQKKIRVIRHPKNAGLSHARNSGYKAMRGDICVPLDADDTLPPGVIEKLYNIFEKAREADFVFGDYIRRDSGKGTEEIIDCSALCASDGFLDPKKLFKNWILLGTSPCRKSAWEKTGGYAETFSFDGQDMDFFMRLLNQGGKGYYVSQTLYEWNKSAKGMNSKVPPEVWTRVNLSNIAFLDKIGEGSTYRKSIMWNSIKSDDFVTARQLARQLVASKSISFSTGVIALLPPAVTHLIYKIVKSIKNKSI